MDAPWIEVGATALRVRVHVQPRASRNEIVGLHGSALKVRLQAPPVDGAANEALAAFMAERLGLPKRAVCVVAGATSRSKTLEIEGTTEAAVLALIAHAATS